MLKKKKKKSVECVAPRRPARHISLRCTLSVYDMRYIVHSAALPCRTSGAHTHRPSALHSRERLRMPWRARTVVRRMTNCKDGICRFFERSGDFVESQPSPGVENPHQPSRFWPLVSVLILNPRPRVSIDMHTAAKGTKHRERTSKDYSRDCNSP